MGVTNRLNDIEVGKFFLERHILVNIPDFNDKLNSMLLMIEKLYAVVGNECEVDNLDSPANQECLLGGHLYSSLL